LYDQEINYIRRLPSLNSARAHPRNNKSVYFKKGKSGIDEKEINLTS